MDKGDKVKLTLPFNDSEGEAILKEGTEGEIVDFTGVLENPIVEFEEGTYEVPKPSIEDA